MIVKSHREGIHMKAETKTETKKFTNLQRQSRELEPMKPEEYKYVKELLEKVDHDNISRIARGSLRPQYIKAIFLAGGLGSGKSYVVRRTTGESWYEDC